MRGFLAVGRLGLVLWWLGTCFFLGGCDTAPSPERLFAYADGNFSATVTGSVTRLVPDGYTGDPSLIGESLANVPRPFSADVSAATDEGGGRVETVTYTEPPALAGLTVSRRTDPATGSTSVTVTRTSRDGYSVRLDLSAVAPFVTDALLEPLSVLLPVGDMSEFTPGNDGTLTVRRVGRERRVTFTFSDGQGVPVRVVWETDMRAGEASVEFRNSAFIRTPTVPRKLVTPPSEREAEKAAFTQGSLLEGAVA